MFKLSQSETYKWPVTIKVPEDGQKFSTQTFTGIFKRLPQSRLTEISKSIGTPDGPTDVEIAREALVGWEDITDGDAAVEFTTATLDRVLDVPGVGTAIVSALLESLSGSKRKN